MITWLKDELRKIAGSDDLHISPFRGDGVTYGTPTWIWPVAVDDALYVRAYNGENSRWYQAAMRQWVLTLPYRLALPPGLGSRLVPRGARRVCPCPACFHTRTARSHGIQDGQADTVTVIQQRFGSGLQLNRRS